MRLFCNRLFNCCVGQSDHDTGIFKISINNGVLYGYVVNIVNRASGLLYWHWHDILIYSGPGGQDINVERCDGSGNSSLLPDIIRGKGVGRCVGTTC